MLPPSATQASFLFAASEDSLRSGGKVKLRRAQNLIWEEDILAEQYDSQSSKLPVHVPASRLKLGEPYSLHLECGGTDECGSTDRQSFVYEFRVVRVKPLHLLHQGQLVIVGRHADIALSKVYRAEFRDREGIVMAALARLLCTENKSIRVNLMYDQLRHEEDTQVQVCQEDHMTPTYFACIRPVRHESLASRRGFVAQVAHNVAYEHFKASDKMKLRSIEGLPHVSALAGADEGKQLNAVLLAKSVIERLPEQVRKLLLEHEIEGLSWAEIAKRHNLSEDKAKQDISRALSRIARVILAGEPEASSGALQRLIDWIKHTLDEVIPYRAG
jgi:DNA-directed RNA polymerase specialized sigma24 family protein